MLVSELYAAVCAEVPLPPGTELHSGDDVERERLALILVTCRVLGVFYHEGHTTNAPVDLEGACGPREREPGPLCKYCERDQCDEDCYHCDSHREETGAEPRLTAQQHRMIGGADALARLGQPIANNKALKVVAGNVTATVSGVLGHRVRIEIPQAWIPMDGPAPRPRTTKHEAVDIMLDAETRTNLRQCLDRIEDRVSIPRALYFAGEPAAASSSVIADMIGVGRYEEAIATFLEFNWKRVLVILARAENHARIANEYGLVLRDQRTYP